MEDIDSYMSKQIEFYKNELKATEWMKNKLFNTTIKSLIENGNGLMATGQFSIELYLEYF